MHKKIYKLTTQQGTTHNGYQWSLPTKSRPGKWHETSGYGELCSGGFLHYYHDPLLSEFLNPIHANISDPILWEAEAHEDAKHLDDNGLKGGCSKMRLVRKMRLRKPTTTQRVAFAIMCAREVYKDDAFAKWACQWLDGSDRSKAAAWAAAADASVASAWTAAEDAARAAALAAAWTAEWAAEWAARAAARAAGIGHIDLASIARKAMQVK